MNDHSPECPVPAMEAEDLHCQDTQDCVLSDVRSASFDNSFRRGWSEALDAAREAVADLTPFVFAYQTWISGDYGYDEGPWVKKENALYAIDALREEQK